MVTPTLPQFPKEIKLGILERFLPHEPGHLFHPFLGHSPRKEEVNLENSALGTIDFKQRRFVGNLIRNCSEVSYTNYRYPLIVQILSSHAGPKRGWPQ